MKRTLLILSIAMGMAACHTKPAIGPGLTKSVSYEDTVGLAQFQNWKMQHERADPSQYYMAAANAAPTAVAAKKVRKPATASAPAPVATATAKKGWSKAAKGTAIGAGSGAILGAVINKKNRVLGGVIGGVVGGGLGYAIGRNMDHKDGRI